MLFKIYAGKRNEPLELVCIKEFAAQERAEQYAFDVALDKVFPWRPEDDIHGYSRAMDMIEYRADEV